MIKGGGQRRRGRGSRKPSDQALRVWLDDPASEPDRRECLIPGLDGAVFSWAWKDTMG